MLAGFALTSQAQDIERPQPKFWFGASAAANFNFYTGTTQTLNADVKAPGAFHKGFGVGPYASILMEYRPDPIWGVMLNLGYDGRGGKFDDAMAPCDCPETLKTKLAYLTIEPSLRITPFASPFYMFIGGSVNFNTNKSFSYTQELQPDSDGDFSAIKEVIYSGQIGAGYDFPVSDPGSRTQVELSPFVSYHPYFGQNPRSVESWSVSTLRVGLALKFARAGEVAPVATGDLQFSVQAPAAVPAKREISESFPVRNYVFFEEGSSKIPNRYVKLDKNQASNFKEGQFQDPEPENEGERSKRQLSAYYNILNILGDRMRSNPGTNVTLIGASAGKGPELGKEYAESVKTYLVVNFAINESRIATEGRNQPLAPSEQPNGEKSLVLLREGDRRVDIVSNSAVLLAPLQIKTLGEDAPDSNVVFKTVSENNDPVQSWALKVTDDKGKVQNFGPFTKEQENISANTILGSRTEGHYKVVMTGQTKEGNVIIKESDLHLVRSTAPKEQGLRYSVLFDFDKSKTVAAYEKFLNEVVAPKITDNATVIIHGHTDIIGEEDYNMNLSKERAKEAQRILESAVAKSGKKGVKFQVTGHGADANAAPFANKYPEERFYNRTVIIDIILSK